MPAPPCAWAGGPLLACGDRHGFRHPVSSVPPVNEQALSKSLASTTLVCQARTNAPVFPVQAAFGRDT